MRAEVRPGAFTCTNSTSPRSRPASVIAAMTAAAVASRWAIRPTDSAGTSAANAMPIASAGDPEGCRAGIRANTAICGLNTPSVPPDNTQGTRIRAASGERSSRSASSNISDWVKKPRVKSLTPPFPSVLPITAMTWAGSRLPVSKSVRRAETSFGPAMPSRKTCVSKQGFVTPAPPRRSARHRGRIGVRCRPTRRRPGRP